MAEVFEEVGDLGGSDAAEGERGELVFRKELGVCGFVTALGVAANDFAEEEGLVGMEGVGRMTVEITVEKRDEFGDADFVAGLFAGFAGGSEGGRLADIGPAAGKGPAAIFEFADEKDAVVLEGGDADINLGSSVTGLLGE